jgi:hypothetical protein
MTPTVTLARGRTQRTVLAGRVQRPLAVYDAVAPVDWRV